MKKRTLVLAGFAASGAIALAACSGDDTTIADGGSDGAVDATHQDVTTSDVTINDAPIDAPKDSGTSDGSDGSCPASWLDLPDADITLAVPDGGGSLFLHASGSGTQDYKCEDTTTDAGPTYAWIFVGPEATLDDCDSNLIGHHFASDPPAAKFPEWQTLDNSYTIQSKSVGLVEDAGSVPWLLLHAVDAGGTGPIAKTLFVQRLYTSGGIAPTTTCDNSSVLNTTVKVPYTAEYYFYGN